MTYAVIMAVIVVMHPIKGMATVPFVASMNHDKPFVSHDACYRWMLKTGDDTALMWEDQMEKGPFVVIRFKTACHEKGQEI